MTIATDHDYFAERERPHRAMALHAAGDAARQCHTTLTDSYASRVIALPVSRRPTIG